MADRFPAIDEPYDGWLSFSGRYDRKQRRFRIDVHRSEGNYPLSAHGLHLLDALYRALIEYYRPFKPHLPYAGQLSDNEWESLLAFERLVLLSGHFVCGARCDCVVINFYKHNGEDKFQVVGTDFLDAIILAVQVSQQAKK